jgi:hypothetical protein
MFKPVKKLSVIFRFRRFIAIFTRARDRRIQSTLAYPISLRSILISVDWHPRLWLDLPNGLFPSRFPTKISNASLRSHSCYVIVTDFITQIIFREEKKFYSSSLGKCDFLQPPVTSSFLGPNALLGVSNGYRRFFPRGYATGA